MNKRNIGVALIIVGAVLVVLTLAWDYLKGEPGIRLGPRSIPALIAGVALVVGGLAMSKGGSAAPPAQ